MKNSVFKGSLYWFFGRSQTPKWFKFGLEQKGILIICAYHLIGVWHAQGSTWISKVEFKSDPTFSMKGLGNTSYIQGIKMYRDNERKLIEWSQSLYVDKVLGRFHMGQSKKGFLHFRHGIYLSKNMSPKTPEKVK